MEDGGNEHVTTQILTSKYHSYLKETELPWEIMKCME